MEGSPVRQRLATLAELMIPLNLLDPDAPEFAPGRCRTLHDITRFCHKKSVRIMFDQSQGVDQRMGKQLRAGVKGGSLFAVAEGYAAESILLKTRLLGYLPIHTRQVDMIMLDQGSATALGHKLATDMDGRARGPASACTADIGVMSGHDSAPCMLCNELIALLEVFL
ncbi:MAG: hypothetical protein BCS36_06725 [Desulfovibrio sp. MES5]|nr:MAG: hypothetical protein BCS36_06725 [Desulfovibrio sp. MES5]